jgi:hypothetical protein
VPIAQVECRDRPDLAHLGAQTEHVDLDQSLRHLAAVRPSVHSHGPSERPGHRGRPREPAEPGTGHPGGQCRQRFGGPCVDHVPVDLDPPEPAAQHDDDAGPTGVGHEQVRTATHHEPRHLVIRDGSPDGGEVVVALGGHENPRGATDLQRRELSQGGVTDDLTAALALEPFEQEVTHT